MHGVEHRWDRRPGDSYGSNVTLDPRTPVIVGVGQFLHRADGLDDALEPVALMEQAVLAAASDAGLDGPPAADSIRVVSLLSWRYRNPARFLAARLGIEPAELGYTAMGGNSPQSLVNATALDIQAGELDVAILSGGESWRTFMRARKAGVTFDWPKAPEGDDPVTIGDELDMNLPAETERGIYMPVQVYPMFETALRAAAGRTPEDHLAHLGSLWSDLSEVAAGNEYAWIRDAKSAEEITTVSSTNRMIGLPYPKYMNSNNDVDMGAAIIMCSVEAARRLGVAEDRWVFPQSGTDCHEHTFVSHRDTFARTPAIELGGRRALELAGVGIDDIGIIDLYSCFPAAVQLGAASLGIDLIAPVVADRRPAVRRRAVEQLRDARHRQRRDRPARTARRTRPGLGERGLRHEARVRRVRHHAAGHTASATRSRRTRSTGCRAVTSRCPPMPPDRRRSRRTP